MCVQRPGRAHRDGVPGARRRLVAASRGLRPLHLAQLLRSSRHFAGRVDPVVANWEASVGASVPRAELWL